MNQTHSQWIAYNLLMFFQLFKLLGDVSRHESEADMHQAEARIVMALSSLLRRRSTKVQEVQLLNIFMLVARSTSRQVKYCIHATKKKCTLHIVAITTPGILHGSTCSS